MRIINLKFSPTWNEEFELPDGSYSISDIQDYFENTFKNMEKRLTKYKIKSRLNSQQDIILNFQLLKQWNQLEAPKVR